MPSGDITTSVGVQFTPKRLKVVGCSFTCTLTGTKLVVTKLATSESG